MIGVIISFAVAAILAITLAVGVVLGLMRGVTLTLKAALLAVRYVKQKLGYRVCE